MVRAKAKAKAEAGAGGGLVDLQVACPGGRRALRPCCGGFIVSVRRRLGARAENPPRTVAGPGPVLEARPGG